MNINKLPSRSKTEYPPTDEWDNLKVEVARLVGQNNLEAATTAINSFAEAHLHRFSDFAEAHAVPAELRTEVTSSLEELKNFVFDSETKSSSINTLTGLLVTLRNQDRAVQEQTGASYTALSDEEKDVREFNKFYVPDEDRDAKLAAYLERMKAKRNGTLETKDDLEGYKDEWMARIDKLLAASEGDAQMQDDLLYLKEQLASVPNLYDLNAVQELARTERDVLYLENELARKKGGVLNDPDVLVLTEDMRADDEESSSPHEPGKTPLQRKRERRARAAAAKEGAKDEPTDKEDESTLGFTTKAENKAKLSEVVRKAMELMGEKKASLESIQAEYLAALKEHHKSRSVLSIAGENFKKHTLPKELRDMKEQWLSARAEHARAQGDSVKVRLEERDSAFAKKVGKEKIEARYNRRFTMRTAILDAQKAEIDARMEGLSSREKNAIDALYEKYKQLPPGARIIGTSAVMMGGAAALSGVGIGATALCLASAPALARWGAEVQKTKGNERASKILSVLASISSIGGAAGLIASDLVKVGHKINRTQKKAKARLAENEFGDLGDLSNLSEMDAQRTNDLEAEENIQRQSRWARILGSLLGGAALGHYAHASTASTPEAHGSVASAHHAETPITAGHPAETAHANSTHVDAAKPEAPVTPETHVKTDVGTETEKASAASSTETPKHAPISATSTSHAAETPATHHDTPATEAPKSTTDFTPAETNPDAAPASEKAEAPLPKTEVPASTSETSHTDTQPSEAPMTTKSLNEREYEGMFGPRPAQEVQTEPVTPSVQETQPPSVAVETDHSVLSAENHTVAPHTEATPTHAETIPSPTPQDTPEHPAPMTTEELNKAQLEKVEDHGQDSTQDQTPSTEALASQIDFTKSQVLLDKNGNLFAYVPRTNDVVANTELSYQTALEYASKHPNVLVHWVRESKNIFGMVTQNVEILKFDPTRSSHPLPYAVDENLNIIKTPPVPAQGEYHKLP